MAQLAVSRDAFRGLFALFAFGEQLNKNPDGACRLLNLFTSSQHISDELLDRWAERAEAAGSETVGSVLCPDARATADGSASYDHASAFLQALLKKLDQTQGSR
jgi:hypothetical protein